VDHVAVEADKFLRAIDDLRAIEAEHEGDADTLLDAWAQRIGLTPRELVVLGAEIAEHTRSRTGAACYGLLLGVRLAEGELS
jgi:hypothetical protein